MTSSTATPAASPTTTLPRGLWPFLIALWIAELTGRFESAMIIAAMKHLIADFGDPAPLGWPVPAHPIVRSAPADFVGRMGRFFWGGAKIFSVIVMFFAENGQKITSNFPLYLKGVGLA